MPRAGTAGVAANVVCLSDGSHAALSSAARGAPAKFRRKPPAPLLQFDTSQRNPMTELFVCLTFDHDNTSSGISRGQTTPTAMSRGDFGIPAARRILALLNAQRLPSTWFIPGHTIESYPSCVAAVHAAGHEIGNHGWTHRVPSTLGAEGEEEELVRGNTAIEQLTGRKPRGYRSPAWDLSPHSISLMLKHGFVYDSSMMGNDYFPYQARDGDKISLLEKFEFGPDTPLVEMPISWALDDFPHFEIHAQRRRDPAGGHECAAGDREFRQRVSLYEEAP